MEEINLNNYSIINNESGIIFVENGQVLLQNSTDGEILQVAYSNVKEFYGLDELNADKSETHMEAEENACEEEENPNQPCSSNGARPLFKWSQEETRFMLHLYSQLLDSVGPLKKFRTKEIMWDHMASAIRKKFGTVLDGIQVESRYKCVIRRTKKALDNNKTSGAVREETIYDADVLDIIAKDDSICIDTGLSQGQVFYKQDALCRMPANTSSPPATLPLFSESPSPPISSTGSTAFSFESENDDEHHPVANKPPKRQQKKSVQVTMFQQYMKQRAEHFERREAKYEEKLKMKIERDKKRDEEKAMREKKKELRLREKEEAKQQRYIENQLLIKELLKK